jgi:hypothetical protein
MHEITEKKVKKELKEVLEKEVDKKYLLDIIEDVLGIFQKYYVRER